MNIGSNFKMNKMTQYTRSHDTKNKEHLRGITRRLLDISLVMAGNLTAFTGWVLEKLLPVSAVSRLQT